MVVDMVTGVVKCIQTGNEVAGIEGTQTTVKLSAASIQ